MINLIITLIELFFGIIYSLNSLSIRNFKQSFKNDIFESYYFFLFCFVFLFQFSGCNDFCVHVFDFFTILMPPCNN